MKLIKAKLTPQGTGMYPERTGVYEGVFKNGIVTLWFEQEYSSYPFSLNFGEYEILEEKEINFDNEQKEVLHNEHREDLLHVINKFFEHIKKD